MTCKTIAAGLLLTALALTAPKQGAAQSLAALPSTPPAASAGAPGVAAAPGLARVWFLHQFTPDQGQRSPMVYVNGVPLASSEPGSLFYRDFVPGTYTFSVETCTEDVNQAATIALAPGSRTDIEIQSLASFHSWSCPNDSTYYARVIPPSWANLYRPQLSYLGVR